MTEFMMLLGLEALPNVWSKRMPLECCCLLLVSINHVAPLKAEALEWVVGCTWSLRSQPQTLPPNPNHYPHTTLKANTSDGWLDALDPLFTKIAKGVGNGIKRDFGASSFVEADGWFSLETGPWLGTFGDDDLTAAVAGAGAGAGVAGGDADSVTAGGDTGGTVATAAAVVTGTIDNTINQPESNNCLGGFTIPSEEEAYTRAQSIFSSLTLAEPNATWIYQGYPWHEARV
jgi:hypothetical protein